jgi:hypothetical protein
VTHLGEISATVAIVDGRVAMSDDVETTLRFETPDLTPLSAGEPHATLRIADDGVRAEIELDANALDALADAVHHAQDANDGQ